VKSARSLFLSILSLLVVAAFSPATARSAVVTADEVYQTSTISSLLEGNYDGLATIGDLRRHGDFGLGTVNRLDGEMVALDGRFYQIRADGKAYVLQDSMQTPFAVVKFFAGDITLALHNRTDEKQLEAFLDESLPSKDLFYAIRIEGTFAYVKTRSVPAQTRPYPRLIDAVKGQKMFEFRNVRGTIVGFRFPAYAGGINVPGYHFHFITQNRNAGGHLLDCDIERAEVFIDKSADFHMTLPVDRNFSGNAGRKERQRELDQIEK
jgi:acetolactate decarboxylase